MSILRKCFKGKGMSSIPLVEVVFEVRFKPQSNFATELLIAINQQFNNHVNIIQTDGLQFPAELKKQQHEFYYVPSYRVNFSNFSLLISDGSFVVLKNTFDVEYEGWDIFKNIPKQILNILKFKNKIADIERYSIKYTNLIQDHLNFKNLNLALSIGSTKLDGQTKFSLKTEEQEDEVIIINEVSSHVEMEIFNDITKNKKKLFGVLLVIDIINNRGVKNISEVDKEFVETLEKLHDIATKKYTNIYNQE